MGSRACVVEGCIQIKEGTEVSRIKAIIDAFSDSVSGNINELSYEADGGTLEFEVNFFGFGGDDNEEVKVLADALNEIIDGGGNLLLVDSEAGDQDIASVRYFLGETYELRREAKLNYGIGLLEQYLSPELGRQFERVREAIHKTVTDIYVEAKAKNSGPRLL